MTVPLNKIAIITVLQFLLKARKSKSSMLVQHFLNIRSTCWTRFLQCVQHIGPTFRKRNDGRLLDSEEEEEETKERGMTRC